MLNRTWIVGLVAVAGGVLVSGGAGVPGGIASAAAAVPREPEATAPVAEAVPARIAKTHGRLGYGRLLKRPPEVEGPEPDEEDDVNPDSPVLPGPVPPGPADAPTADPAGPAGAAAGRAGSLVALAFANDYVLFRSTAVAQGTGVTTATGEPTVANDRNGVLFTGNKHAEVSGDDGLTWQYLNPADPKSYPQYDGGFCCDQIAYAVDRGGYSLVFWLRQFRNSGVVKNGATGRLSLITYQGRGELLAQADYCEVDFEPSQFGFPTNTYFDFNQMSNTKKYLYISSKAEQNLGDVDGDGQLDGKFLGGVVWRIELDDLDSDDCSPPVQYFSGAGTGFNPALVQGAGDLDTMYWAFHGATTDQLTITRMRDSAATGDVFNVAISPYLATPRKNANCPLADGTDPCLRVNDPVNTGYSTGNEIGWLWNVGQGNGFPFPHIRVARFRADPVKAPVLIDEPDIWNESHAWIYPAIGVDRAHHIGLSAYLMGVDQLPEAATTLIDDVAPDTDWHSLTFHGVKTSDSGVAGNTWGDYQAVRPYGDCMNTFAAAVMTMQGGSASGNSEHRFAWFGRERDGCADLAVTAVGIAPTAVTASKQVLIGETTRNLGSGTADASTTRFYLSRDAAHSDDDLRLDATAAVPALGRSASNGQLVSATAPFGTHGTFYVLACADDREKVDEISDTNNCLAAPDTLAVTSPELTGIAVEVSVGSLIHARTSAAVPVSLRLQLPKGAPRRPTATVFLVARSAVGRTMTRLGTLRPAVTARADTSGRILLRRVLHLPRTAPRARRQFLVACIGAPSPAHCVVSRQPLFVTAT